MDHPYFSRQSLLHDCLQLLYDIDPAVMNNYNYVEPFHWGTLAEMLLVTQESPVCIEVHDCLVQESRLDIESLE